MSNTFCVLPWMYLSTTTKGFVRTCCRAEILKKENGDAYQLGQDDMATVWNSSVLKEIRRDLMAGHRASQCALCWADEDLGRDSLRIHENHRWETRGQGSAWLDRMSSDGELSELPTYMEIRAGNHCNLKCIMCGPKNSSTWNEDAEIFDGDYEWLKGRESATKYQAGWFEQPKFQAFVGKNIKRFEEIYFTGGEPLLLRGHYQFLQMLLDAGLGDRVRLRYDTNLTKLNDKVIGLWRQFRNVVVSVSLDGWGPVASYIRYPLEWAHIYGNMLQLSELPHVETRVNFAMGALNGEHFEVFMENIKSSPLRNFVIQSSIVYDPFCLSMRVLDSEDKSRLVSSLRRAAKRWGMDRPLDSVVRYAESEDWTAKRPQLLKYLRDLDRLRGLNSQEVFGHLSTLREEAPHR